MKKYVKLILIVLIVTFAFSIAVFSVNAVNLENNESHWAIDYMYLIANKNILKVPEQYDFKPSAYLTRKETAYAMMRIQGYYYSDNITSVFSDVPGNMEYAGAIKWAYENGVMSGTSSTTFDPNGTIKRQDICVVLNAYFNEFNVSVPVVDSSISYTDFSDAAQVSSYARAAVDRMLQAGIISGNTDGTLAPKDAVKRGQAAVMFTNAYALTYNSANSINVYARNENGDVGKPLMYVYRPQDATAMYPEYPVLGTLGIIKKTGLNTNKRYGVNIVQKYPYTLVPLDDLVYPSYKFIFVTIPEVAANPDDYCSPLDNFSASTSWPHNSSLVTNSSTLCNAFCASNKGNFINDKCPHTYMNVFIPQNFGWRYGANNQCEFHQGVDITRLNNGSVTSSTPVYSIFTNYAKVTIREENPSSPYGNTVQLHWGWEYVTYMHLSSISSALPAVNEWCPGESVIGNVGNTGNSTGTHLHIQISNKEILYPTTAEQRAAFLDPLRFFG